MHRLSNTSVSLVTYPEEKQWGIHGGFMSLEFRKSDCMRRCLGGLAAAALLVLATSVGASADEQTFTAPDGATVLWVDLEAEGLDATDVSGVLIDGESQEPLDLLASPSGLTATLAEFPQEFELRFTSTREIPAQLAITFATTDKAVVSEESSSTVISAITGPSPEETPQPDEGQTDPDSSEGDEENSSEDGTGKDPDSANPTTDAKDTDGKTTDPGDPVVTGASVTWSLAAALTLVAAGLTTLAIRRRGAQNND